MPTDHQHQPLIGPDGIDDEPSMLIEDARQRLRDDDERNTEGKKLARRLFIAFALIALLGVIFYVVLPHYGVRMPPILPLLCFGAIMAGAVLSAREEAANNKPDAPDPSCGCNDGDGRPFGCCQGPRPMQSFRDKPEDHSRPKR